jgi:hypothetical protein
MLTVHLSPGLHKREGERETRVTAVYDWRSEDRRRRDGCREPERTAAAATAAEASEDP